MIILKARDGFEPIDLLTITIVNELKNTGVYKYNKLAYLTEYLFIKNFAARLTGEYFIKLPHGPAIGNYKKQIEGIYDKGIFKIDLNELKKKRPVDDDKAMKLPIEIREFNNDFLIKNEVILSFIKAVINKYAYIDNDTLEILVYKTKPVVNYLGKFSNGFKKETGSYILNDCIRLKEHERSKSAGRRLYLKHIEKYPDVKEDQYPEFEKEFSYLEQMRPEWP